MANPHHLPAGRPDGGQFTFSFVGGFVAGGGIPWEVATADPKDIPDASIIPMYEALASIGYTDEDLFSENARRHPTDPTNQDERKRRLKDTIRSLYFGKAIASPLAQSLVVATDRYGDTIARGGQVKALANDDGSYQLVHTTNNSVSTYMNGLSEIGGSQAVVYNQRTGTLRRGAYCVPVGKPRRIAGTSVDRGRRNRLTEVARETEARQGKVAAEVNKRITDSTTREGRRLGSDDYAGRMSVSVFRGKSGDLYIQDCILCDRHERTIADMYAKELGSSVFSATRPKDIVNPIAGDTNTLHTDDFAVVKSDFGGMSAGVVADTGRKSKVPEAVAEQMFNQHDEMKRRRDDEYQKAHGKPRPEKTEEQRQRERLLGKARRLRRNQAMREQEAGRNPIKVKGGWLFQGEEGYDEALIQAVRAEKPEMMSTYDSVQKSTSDAIKGQQKRQAERVSARDRKRLQRERDKAIKNANAQGLKAVKYRVDDTRSGTLAVAIEGTPEYDQALKMRTAQVIAP